MPEKTASQRFARPAAFFFLMVGAQGCASFVRMEIPDEFKIKKLKEDPPITLHEPACPVRPILEA